MDGTKGHIMPEDSYYPEPDSSEELGGEDSPKSDMPGEETALIPKALLAGKQFEPGEEVVFKIVHMYDDEVEIAYATGEEKEPEKKSAMSESMDDMDKMANPKGY